MIRNITRTKLYRSVTEKKATTLSPISKKKKLIRPIIYNSNRRIISNLNERLFNAAQRRQPTYKTLAELVQEFDKKTRVYEDENVKNPANKMKNLRKNFVPKSPKLLSKNRNRTRTALSQLEQDELIARTIKKNTFKAQPMNKKIFENYATGVPRVAKIPSTTSKKPTTSIKNLEFNFKTEQRIERKKEKMQAIQQSIENVNNFVFKARPMPVFKKVPIMMRNNQLIMRKQASDMCLNTGEKKMTNSTIKQTSDTTLNRFAQSEQIKNDNHYDIEGDKQTVQENKENNELMNKSLNENLTTFKMMEEESSFCEFKSLTNFENNNEINLINTDESVQISSN